MRLEQSIKQEKGSINLFLSIAMRNERSQAILEPVHKYVPAETSIQDSNKDKADESNRPSDKKRGYSNTF